MKCLVIFTVALVAAASLAPTAALGKGGDGAISEAIIEGPGLDGKILLPGGSGSGGAGGAGMARLAQLTESAFFPAAFGPRILTGYGQFADSKLRERPMGDLGPRYTITYVMRGSNGRSARIRQDLYPFAELSHVPYLVHGQVVTYMEPGQRTLGDERTVGGWYVATTHLKDVLVAAGLPESPSAGGGSEPPWAVIGALAGIGIALVLAALIRRHGQRRTVTA